MLKKIALHVLIGSVLFILGACLHDFSSLKAAGDTIAFTGLAYAGIAAILIIFNVRTPGFISSLINNRKRLQAHKELLIFKKLFDENIITQDEFDLQTDKLKKIILQA